ncbi:Do family serine endopeptidase [Alphaproteobacteria bacterium]|nr:Do family serine endopeptidase [Alphaproteobacteria bacterium]
MVVPKDDNQIKLSFAPVVSRVSPAVVNIFTSRKKQSVTSSPFFDDPFFKRFFKEFGLIQPNSKIQNSLGSGVIVNENGIIITNSHVISEADEIIVALSDRRQFPAKVILADERTDLAVLKISVYGEKLPHLNLMNSDNLNIGDLVLAIGNPFGVGKTVTSGIISALARSRGGVGDFQFFIQTDAAINPGNSGGALVTMDGRLAGINTAIYSRSGGSIGIGFAIPSNMVASVINAAINNGKIIRPWLGASGIGLDPDKAKEFGLDSPNGVLIDVIFSGGPLDKSGIKSKDIILSFNGAKVNDYASLLYRVAISKIGEIVDLTVWREGRIFQSKIILSKAPEKPLRYITDIDGASPLSGARIANLSPALAEELGLDSIKFSKGVIILAISRFSNAYNASLRPGDVLFKINNIQIDNVKKLVVLIKESKNWKIEFERNGRKYNLMVRN